MTGPTGSTMRAVRTRAWGEPPTVEEVPTPTLRSGETLVRVDAAAVSHLDLTVAGGRFDVRPDLPYTGGVAGSGTVVESDVFEPGTQVVLRGGGAGLTRDGTWAEFVSTRSKALAPLPAGLTPELGAVYFVPTTTARVALDAVARLGTWDAELAATPADEVVVVGGAAGAVGSMVTQLSLRAGCRVLALVAGPEQADLVPAGAEVVDGTDAAAAVALADERPATLLVDMLGGPGLAARSTWVRPGGRVAAVGYVAGTETALDLPRWLLRDVALLPVNMMRRDPEARRLAPALAGMLVRGELTLDVETFALQDAPEALARLAAGTLRGRPVLVPGPR